MRHLLTAAACLGACPGDSKRKNSFALMFVSMTSRCEGPFEFVMFGRPEKLPSRALDADELVERIP